MYIYTHNIYIYTDVGGAEGKIYISYPRDWGLQTQFYFTFWSKNNNFAPTLLVTRRSKCISEDAKEKWFLKKILTIFFRNIFFSDFFFVFLGSSETYANPSVNKIGDKLDFSSNNLKLTFIKWKNEEKKLENCFAYVSEHYAFCNQTLNLATFQGRFACHY